MGIMRTPKPGAVHQFGGWRTWARRWPSRGAGERGHAGAEARVGAWAGIVVMFFVSHNQMANGVVFRKLRYY